MVPAPTHDRNEEHEQTEHGQAGGQPQLPQRRPSRLDPTPNRHEQGESRGGVIAMIDLDHFEAPNDTDGCDSIQATPRSVLRLVTPWPGSMVTSIVMFDDLDEVELTKIFAPRRRSTTGRPLGSLVWPAQLSSKQPNRGRRDRRAARRSYIGLPEAALLRG